MDYHNLIILGSGWGYEAARKSMLRKFSNLKTAEDLNLQVNSKGNYILDPLKNNVIIFAGYKPIVPNNVLLNNNCINIHYSLLPAYRGLHSVVWAILNDEDYLGLTIHQMSEYIDDGDIIHQFSLINDRVKTSSEYMGLLNDYIYCNLGDIISRYIKEQITPIPQNKKFASWVGRRNLDDCKIDFEKPISFQKRFFRALTKPYPLPWVSSKGKKYIATQVDFYENKTKCHNGRILNIDNEGIWVKCLDGYIIFREMRDESNNIIDLNRFHIGQKFE